MCSNAKSSISNLKARNKKIEQENYLVQLKSLEDQIDMLKLESKLIYLSINLANTEKSKKEIEWSGTYGKMMRNLMQLQTDVDNLQFENIENT